MRTLVVSDLHLGVRLKRDVLRRPEPLEALLAALDAGRDATRIEVRRPAAEEFDRELRAALAGTVWHTGCTNWYVDENGNDPNQWPWLWSTYRRRTERVDRSTYELA